MQLDSIRGLVSLELEQVDHLIHQYLESSVPLTQTISQHLIQGGGKRVRPLVVLLAAKSIQTPNDSAVLLAAIIEMIHTATLLHDDVVDQSSQRRGKPSAQMLWGNAAPILVGDFLYSRAFEMMVSTQSFKILEILARATNIISEGEMLQLSKRHDPNLAEHDYDNVIYAKTAKLFEVAAQLPAVTAHSSHTFEQALRDYGKHVGIVFQLVDDVLDYQAPADVMGKNVGDDLADGKTTLPLIHALNHSSPQLQQVIRQAIQQGTLDDFHLIQDAIKSTGAIDYTMDKARKHLDLALSALNKLPSSEYVEALSALAKFALKRDR